MSRSTHIVFTLAIITGCATGPADLDDGDQVSSVESALTIVPSAGQWVYGELEPLTTNCAVSNLLSYVTHLVTGPFTLDAVTTSSFQVTPSDGTGPFTCAYSDARFHCPDRARASIDLRPFVDLAVTVQVTATGLMTDSRHAIGKQGAGVTCVGSRCDLLGPTPCGFVDNFEGVDTYGFEAGGVAGDMFGYVKDDNRELPRMMPSGYGYTYGPTAVHVYEIEH
jgi:hypothetical protein